MTILPGTRLGPYEMLSPIGAGGMGEVYRARDTRLDRIVAIKVLPSHLADRPELRERFEREARTIASLNHPHICALYDIGHQDGIDFLVLEYLEGETLAQRLLKGSLPLEQVLQYAIEIADALDKAHRKGITHRDLKPGNVMVTKSGTKLLDFGLAKLQQEAAPATPVADLPTMTHAITGEGTILGTLQYMAPEQVEGKTDEIDARTDIFAFGALVYEMATGRKAFEGKTSASVMAKILEVDPPPMASLQPMTPPALDRAVKKCLAKEPEKRWQAASDVCDELKWIAEGGSQAGLAQPAAAKGIRSLGRWGLILGAGALLLAAVASLATWHLKPSLPQPVSRFTITLPPGQQLAGLDSGPALALSPDGTHLAYVATQGGTQQIYLRAMDSLEATPVSGTQGAVEPFFSPDGQWLGFFADSKLKRISVSGGAATVLGDAAYPHAASWGGKDVIAFSSDNSPVLQLLAEAGSTPGTLTPLKVKGEFLRRWPELLPGGKAVLFSTSANNANWTNAQVGVQIVGSDERRNLIQGGTNPHFAASGHLVYAQAGNLMAVVFDPQRLTATGAAIPVEQGILQSIGNGYAQYSISATGTMVYVPGSVQARERKLAWVSRNGTEQPLSAPARDYEFPRISPDGRRVAVSIVDQETQVWLYDLTRNTLTRLTFEGNFNNTPAWTPDGKRITFESSRAGPTNIFWQLADGSGGLERLTNNEYLNAPTSWSPDGQVLAFHEINPTTQRDIWVLRMGDPSPGSGQALSAGSAQVRQPQPFLRTPFNEADPRFSPDGRWLAYESDQSGRQEIYVQPFPGPGGKWQISTDGGSEPVWNRNGRELFYRSGDKMMAVDIATQTGFTAGTPRMLFQGPYEKAPIPVSDYDISPDGQRFLMVKSSEQTQAAPTQINVVLNWFEELKQKVPTGKK